MQPIVTVTGATGKVGKAVTEHLLKHGVHVRAVARSAEHLAPLATQGAEVHAGSLDDVPFLAKAFRGSTAVFALLPPSAPDVSDYLADQARMTAHLVQALDMSGVERVVALSGQGAGLRIGNFAVFTGLEEALRSLDGLAVVALRSCYQMTNHLGAIPLIKRAGINAGGLRADLPLSMIAPRDIAAVAGEYLLAPSFSGYQVRDLLGPREYTLREATTILGTAIGRPDLPYIEWSYAEARENLLGMGFSVSRAETLLELQTALNDGPANASTPRTAANTTPTTLEEFARDTFVPAYQASLALR
jgi:uncharacterized protein YbjT (DUF2867 family)